VGKELDGHCRLEYKRGKINHYTNKGMEILKKMLKEGKHGEPEFSELKRRFLHSRKLPTGNHVRFSGKNEIKQKEKK